MRAPCDDSTTVLLFSRSSSSMTCANTAALERAANQKIQVARNKYKDKLMGGTLEPDEAEEQKELRTLRSAAAFRGSLSAFLMASLTESYSGLLSEHINSSCQRPGTQAAAARTLAKSPTSSPRDKPDPSLRDDDDSEMETHSFLLDVATSALLMLSHKDGAEGALQLVNFAMVRIYGILHVSLLDAYQSLEPRWADLAGLEHRWLAFAAFICVQRWHSHHRIIRVILCCVFSICTARYTRRS